jgi:hypothetical protein
MFSYSREFIRLSVISFISSIFYLFFSFKEISISECLSSFIDSKL